MSLWPNERVLVTGAGGFIGSHLVGRLVAQGAQVRALLHYNSRSSCGNLEFLTPDELARVEVVFGDVCDAGCVDQAVRGCQIVFHLAALVGIPYSYTAPQSYLDTNVYGTLNVLKAALAHGVSRVVHTSTSEAYGTARYTPMDENHSLQAQSPYSASKIAADKLAEAYHLSFGLPVATVRPFNTFGPRQSARAIVPTIVSQLLAGKDPIELGSLEPVRDLTYVEDTVRGFLAVAQCEAAIGETIHLGSGQGIAIGQLARLLCEMLRPEARIVVRDTRVRPPRSEVMTLVCDGAKARSLLGWQPQIPLSEGLARTVDFVQLHPEHYRADQYRI